MVNLGSRLAGRVHRCLNFSRGGHSVGSCRRTRSTLYLNITNRFTIGENFFTGNLISSKTIGSCGLCLRSCLHKCERGIGTKRHEEGGTFNFVINSVGSQGPSGHVGPGAKRVI